MLVVAILVLLVALLLLGMPLVFAMGTTAVIYLYITDIHFSMLAQRMTSAVDSFLILAIPFFYLAGELMNACKLTDRIVAMAKALVGHIQGGLAQVNIVASMIFAGMSGSATADTAALGSVLIPAMKKEGYHADFSAAVTVASAMIGPIIPPSVAMVIFGAVADVSIGRLLLAGILPGLPAAFATCRCLSPCHVPLSSPLHLARNVRISRKTRPCTLRIKGYVT